MAIEKDTLIEILKDELSNKQSKLYKEVAEIVKNEILDHLHTDNGTNLWWSSPLPVKPIKDKSSMTKNESITFAHSDIEVSDTVLQFLRSKFPDESYRLFLIKDLRELGKECTELANWVESECKDIDEGKTILRIFLD